MMKLSCMPGSILLLALALCSMPSFSSDFAPPALTTAALPPAPCMVPDNGFGTADVPVTCLEGYIGQMVMTAGLPAGSTIEIDAAINSVNGHVTVPGGFLGGEIVSCNANLLMEMDGTGALNGFSRMINMPVTIEVHLAPRTYGDPIQDFDMQLTSLQGQLFGDPDFCTFIVGAGIGVGVPSPGHTTLTRLGPPGSDFSVDSFFDIAYSIQFEGCPGSIFEGMNGAELGSGIFQAGEATPGGCDPAFTALNNGAGSVDLPTFHPDAFQEPITIIDGLPVGTTIECVVTWTDPLFRNIAPGGVLGGETSNFSFATLQLNMTGTGTLNGFSRNIWMQVEGEMHSAPRTPGDAVQDFATDLAALDGTIFGDPDFDQITIRAGTIHGLPSPGNTTLTRLGPPGSEFIVDSFFDVAYEIEFTGAPGSVLDGFSGTTSGQVTMQNPLGGEGCDDSDPCTTDICDPITGECTHIPVDCDDEDPCTEDFCIDGECIHVPYSLPPEELVPPQFPCLQYLGVVVINDFVFDDGLSTLPENFVAPAGGYELLTSHTLVVDFVTCYDYVVSFFYGPIDCDDGDPCTSDWCDPNTGLCMQTPVDCDDGNPCTADFCDEDGICQHVPIFCDDGDPCTIDYCDGITGDCVHVPMDCNDDDPCTFDYCDDGECFNIPIDCDDGLDCTIDYCDPILGCVHECIDDSCPGDMNGDNMVTTTDLLMFLGVFGTDCDP